MYDTTFLAYLAGLFDGEGCIAIERVKADDHKYGLRYQLKTTIQIREYWILEEIQGVFGGSLRIDNRKNELHAPVGRWRLTDKGAAIFITAILPYLRLKKEQALLALEFRQVKESFQRGYRKARTPEQLAAVEQCYQQMRTLNTRGVSRIAR